ncbi:hypothetical protein LMJF_12_0420 [Leishmania major strain Friedlin]|uniref:Alcohol dehydrogenase iron-type/glycerol dehydrogenase GldA domain-containing protein n=1 Tax=Leishmania major TaxID=5664 RepID=Q4QGQ0_LEIMA|nr:hypothetical protein LMJF_12_0420 [Leishmania major strain Friedlin]CAG9570449.1 hypothetical_protein_-_conserved [Leishmania major strain Friedlin]CAJ02579.1 hypothetical protein LMJF_12_0420 [Leishmania major strain Friedlin]|eukprot:XP_001681648.1 hypothetical protein LMJF_12_0420 [Leishmania major strain Friedlin]
MHVTCLCAAASAFYIPMMRLVSAGSRRASGPKIRSMNFENPPLIVTDKGVRRFGLLDAVVATLRKDAGITSMIVCDDLQPNSTVVSVYNGRRKVLKESRCDSIIGFGSVSSRDAAPRHCAARTHTSTRNQQRHVPRRIWVP